MKNLKNIALIIFIIAGIFISSCKKEGEGGHSSVSGNVKHHSKLIPNAIVYIKYGATEFPGPDINLYDAHVTSDTNAHYEIKDLRKGDYYLYGVGTDISGPFTVSGGIGIRLKYNKSSVNDVPVTE